jgi:hypothetical protein
MVIKILNTSVTVPAVFAGIAYTGLADIAHAGVPRGVEWLIHLRCRALCVHYPIRWIRPRSHDS